MTGYGLHSRDLDDAFVGDGTHNPSLKILIKFLRYETLITTDYVGTIWGHSAAQDSALRIAAIIHDYADWACKSWGLDAQDWHGSEKPS